MLVRRRNPAGHPRRTRSRSRRRRRGRVGPAHKSEQVTERGFARLAHAALAFLFSGPVTEQMWTWMLPNPFK